MSLAIPNPVLREIFERNEVLDREGKPLLLQENVTSEFAEALYRTVLQERPKAVLEVGMAYGVTSLAILTALRDVGEGGTLTSIDPFQSTDWSGLGMLNVQRSGLAATHTLIEEPDYLALPRLLGEDRRFDFAYIDGWHNFEYVLLDTFYVHKLLVVGGVVGFNDCEWPAVRSVVNFLRIHRQVEELAVLPKRYGSRASWVGTLRRIDRRATGSRLTNARLVGPLLGRRREDRYFRKLSEAEPAHGFWSPRWSPFRSPGFAR